MDLKLALSLHMLQMLIDTFICFVAQRYTSQLFCDFMGTTSTGAEVLII